MAKVTPTAASDAVVETRASMAKKAKARARVERLGAGKSYFDVTLGDIGELGVGIRLYFMLTKYTSMLFVVMSLCAAPSAVIHYYGNGVTAATKDPIGLNYVSLANEGINAEYIPTNCTYMGGAMDCSLRTIDTPLTTSPKMGAYISTICDCVYSLVFVVFIIVFSNRCRAIVAAHARENITPAKYAVYVRGFPRDATEAEIMAHFSGLYDLSQPAQWFPMWLGCFGRRRPVKPRGSKKGQDGGDPTTPCRSFEPVQDVSHVDGNEAYLQSWVAEVSVARPVGKFLRLFLALEKLTQRIAMLEATIAEYRKQERRFRKLLPLAQAELATLQTQLETKTNKMTTLRTEGNQRLSECECAFVVFNHVESQQQCLADYRMSKSWWKRCFQPKALRFRGIHALKVTAAPEPSNIVWENLETPAVERFARRSFTNFVTFLLLIVSCAIISLAQGAQQTFNKPGPANLCSKILKVYQGPNYEDDAAANSSAVHGTNATEWTLFWNASVTCPAQGSFDIAYNRSAVPFPPTVPSFNDVASSNLTRCTSACFAPGLTTCGTLPCFTTDYNYTATTARRANADDGCESYDASSILLCYCKPKLESYLQTDGLYNGPRKLWEVELPCREYITAFLTKNGLLIAAAVTVILVNTVLRGVFYAFGGFERHSSESNKAAAIVLKLFFAQWINTAVIVLLVNARLGNVPAIQFLLSGKLTDMERGWYTSVGAGITLTMLVNVVTPHIGPLLATYLILPLKRGIKQFTTVTSPQMNALFANPDFDISVRYPVVLNTIFVTFMYAGGMPALLPLGAVSCYLNYAIDKLMLMKLYRVRTAYDQALGNLALSLFPWILLVHLGFSAWAYGVSSLLQSDLLNVTALAKQATSALASVQTSLNGQDAAAPNATSLDDDAGAVDPTQVLHAMLLDQLDAITDPTLAELLGGVLKAYSKIVRVNTFPMFFFFVLVLLYLVLHRVLAPLFHVTVGAVFRFLALCLRKVRCSSGRVAATAAGTNATPVFPGFTALFERPLASDEVTAGKGGDDDGKKTPQKAVDAARGFEVDATRGVVICRGADGQRLRSWEATAAQVKTYAIEKNPKYTTAVAKLLEANQRLLTADAAPPAQQTPMTEDDMRPPATVTHD